MHRFVVHTHKGLNEHSILWREVVGVQRCEPTETRRTEVEIITVVVVLRIRIETYKTCQAHHKDKVEIGKLLRAGIKPLKSTGDILEKQWIVLQKLRQEQGNGKFPRVCGKTYIRYCYPDVAQLLQLCLGTNVKLYI